MTDAKTLANAWIRLHRLPKQSTERERLFWSWEEVTEMCHTSPETAWNVIQETIARDHSDPVLASVGAGPFEPDGNLLNDVLSFRISYIATPGLCGGDNSYQLTAHDRSVFVRRLRWLADREV